MKEEIGILNDPILIYQLSSRRVERQPNGNIKLESKKKSGQKSPDRGDALALAWYARHTIMGGGDHISDAQAENDAAGVFRETEREFLARGKRKDQEYLDEVEQIISSGAKLEADEIPD